MSVEKAKEIVWIEAANWTGRVIYRSIKEALAELEACVSESVGVYDVTDLYIDESKLDTGEFIELARKYIPPKELFDKILVTDISEQPGQLERFLHEACDRLKRQAEQLTEFETNFNNLVQINNENIDRIEKLQEELSEARAEAHNASLYADERNELREQLAAKNLIIDRLNKRLDDIGGQC